MDFQDTLRTSIARRFAARVERGKGFWFWLDTSDPLLMRGECSRGRSGMAQLREVALGRARPLGRLRKLLFQAALDAASELHGVASSRELVPCLAVEWAGLLAGQLGLPLVFPIHSQDESRQRAIVEFARRLDELGSELQESIEVLAKEIVEGARTLAEEENSERIEIVRRPDSLLVYGYREDYRTFELTLDDFLRRVTVDLSSATIESTSSSLAELQGLLPDFGPEQLEGMSPGLARVLSDSSASTTVIQVAVGEVSGVAADILLRLDNWRGEHGPSLAKLEARRSHSEFLLENVHQEIFYFPPVQLVASLEVSSATLEWMIPNPHVRIPSASPSWVHPYTGKLSRDSDELHQVIRGEEPMQPISPAAREMFPLLGVTSMDAWTGDLCLDGQAEELERRNTELREAFRRNQEPKLGELVSELWTIARHGLTRSHQKNEETPRQPFTAPPLKYPVRDLGRVRSSSLADRLFPYSPD